MIIVVGGIKGGCGKSTIATNLTILRNNADKKVLLVDTDEQKSVSTWALQRTESGHHTEWTTIQLSGASTRNELLKMEGNYDDIIIDCAGTDSISQRSALTIADCYLLPFYPGSLDIWTVKPVTKLINEVKIINPKLKSYAFISRGDTTGKDNEATLEILKEFPEFVCLPFVISQRKAFRNAAAYGLGVTEIPIVDKKAKNEIEQLYHFIYRTGKKKTSKGYSLDI